ncbi:MAG TPA: lipopolysaccharide biosynthesis protein [Actinophytocola sp.]|jgi:putative peptidoglycan lipid II flippase|uniref:lipopolysaccharide biosynthesis protein n=1 Tax=Actinophytocola sp. TaxID=1872138 RepID=UPI002F95E841
MVEKENPLARMLRPVRLDRPIATSLARGSVYSTTGLVAQGILRFATSFLVGHIAGKSVLGEVASAIAMSLTLALLWPTTTGSAASMFLARARGAARPEELRSTAAHLRMRTMQTGLLLGAVCLPLWVLVDRGSWPDALSVAALTIAYSGYSFTRGVQFGAGQVLRATMWDVTSVVLGLGCLVVLLVGGVRSTALVLPLVLTYGLYTLAGWPYGARGKVDRARRRELDGFVVLGAIGTLASTGFLQLSQIAAKLAAGDADAGQYASAIALATPASLLATSLTLVLLPSLSETFGRGDMTAFRAQTNNATRALAVTMVAIFCSIMLCSRLIVAVVWGAKFAGAEKLLPVLVIAVLATNLCVASVNALNTRSRRGMMINTISSIIGMTLGVVLWLVLAPRLGLNGVAIGYLCGTITIAAIPIAWVWRKDGHHWGLVYGKVVLGVAIAVGLVVVAHVTNLPLLLDPVCALVFLAIWWLLNRADVAKLPIPGLRRR